MCPSLAARGGAGGDGDADSSPVHAISRATLRELNRRLAGAAVPMSRFRPNIVIDGWECPHMDDRARRVRAGDAELGYAELAIRCAVTLVDQGTGVKAGPEPIRMLATYRRARPSLRRAGATSASWATFFTRASHIVLAARSTTIRAVARLSGAVQQFGHEV